jgi:hypothetical protein
VRSGSFATSNNRPRSIEVNMKRNAEHPWSLWSASSLGPYISTTVLAIPASNAQGRYSPTGVAWTTDPWGAGDNRVLTGDLQTNPERPLGQWNLGEAHMRGADSGTFILNGQVRTRGWNFQNRLNSGSSMPRIPYNRGNIGLQSEGAVIFYRNFEIMELDSITGLPLHATTAVKAALSLHGAHRPGLVIAHTGSMLWIDHPSGASGFSVYDSKGRKIWVYRGTESRVAVPARLGPGILQIRREP